MTGFRVRCTATLLFLAFGAPAFAHEDQRLQAALAGDAASRRQYECGVLLSQLAHGYQGAKDAPAAQELFKRARQAAEGIRHPYIKEAMAAHLANEVAGDDLEQAERLLNSIKDTELWVKTAWKLVRKHARAGRKDSVKLLLAECTRRARLVEDLELRAELISGTGAGYRELDPTLGVPLVYESYGLAQALKDPYAQAIMFNEVGAHLVDIGHREEAVAVFDKVDALVARIDDPLKRARALAMLGGEQAEKGLRDRAAAALEKGVTSAKQLKDGDDKWAVLSELARNFGQSHRFERGVQVADGIADPYHRAEGYLRIAKNQSRQKLPMESAALLGQIDQLTGKITDPYLRGSVLRKLASEYADLKQPDKARAALDRARQSAAEVEKQAARPAKD